MLIKDLVAQFNVVARTEYNKAYQEFEPKFKDLLFEYESGPVASVDFPFIGFLMGMEKFTGSRNHQTFPEGYKFIVRNEEWDMSVDIPLKELDRASSVGSLQGLNPYKLRISELPKLVKDHPIELAFDMLEAGDASTYGKTFDGQTFFATTHDYGTAAGTQSNIITAGAGVTVANLITDLTNAITRMNTFHYFQGGTTAGKKRKLNKTMNRLLVVCPDQLFGAFEQVRTQSILANGEENTMKGRFELVALPFSDANDWYLINLDSSMFRPFLYQIEKPVEIDLPTPSDESVRERKMASYGAYGRYNVAYGAWWTAVMIQNS